MFGARKRSPIPEEDRRAASGAHRILFRRMAFRARHIPRLGRQICDALRAWRAEGWSDGGRGKESGNICCGVGCVASVHRCHLFLELENHCVALRTLERCWSGVEWNGVAYVHGPRQADMIG